MYRCVCLQHVYLCPLCVPGAHKGQHRALNLLELGLQSVVICHVGAEFSQMFSTPDSEFFQFHSRSISLHLGPSMLCRLGLFPYGKMVGPGLSLPTVHCLKGATSLILSGETFSQSFIACELKHKSPSVLHSITPKSFYI